MSKKNMTVDELISYFEMSVKVEGWPDPTLSPAYHAASTLRELAAKCDEARKEACKFEAMFECARRAGGLPEEDVIVQMAREVAKERGWDCFDKKAAFDPGPRPDSMANISCLKEQLDEARRNLCELYEKGQPSASSMTKYDYAAELNWDCYGKDSMNSKDVAAQHAAFIRNLPRGDKAAELQCEGAARFLEQVVAENEDLKRHARRMRVAEAIAASEQFMWLMAGSNFVESNLKSLRPAYDLWKERGGLPVMMCRMTDEQRKNLEAVRRLDKMLADEAEVRGQ